MKYLDEFRDGNLAQKLAREIRQIATRKWSLMEVCGGQTHSIVRNGIDQLLDGVVEMIHGPGCPVCVTPLELIDKALAIASQSGIIFCSFGDMIRVPGSKVDLFRVKSEGGDIRIVYSPLDALQIARQNPNREVVLFGIGFETTAPANAMAVHQAKVQGIMNFSMMVSHVLVPPAIEAILNSPTCRVQAFLAAGHVCSVMGYWQYYRLVERYKVPIVITGFEPLDLLEGIRRTVHLLEAGTPQVENAYERAVCFEGNHPAQKLLAEVFEVADRGWRGIGTIPHSGWRLSETYRKFDAELRFNVSGITAEESPLCHSGKVFRATSSPTNARASGPPVPRAAHLAQPWSPPKVPAPPTITTVASWLWSPSSEHLRASRSLAMDMPAPAPRLPHNRHGAMAVAESSALNSSSTSSSLPFATLRSRSWATPRCSTRPQTGSLSLPTPTSSCHSSFPADRSPI